jgi:hypothetical protein
LIVDLPVLNPEWPIDILFLLFFLVCLSNAHWVVDGSVSVVTYITHGVHIHRAVMFRSSGSSLWNFLWDSLRHIVDQLILFGSLDFSWLSDTWTVLNLRSASSNVCLVRLDDVAFYMKHFFIRIFITAACSATTELLISHLLYFYLYLKVTNFFKYYNFTIKGIWRTILGKINYNN